jgi:hypothetical protein
VTFVLTAIPFFFLLALDLLVEHQVGLLTGVVVDLETVIALLLVPVAFLTGTDLAEWAEAAASTVGGLARRLRSPWVLISLTVAAAGGIAAYWIIQLAQFSESGIEVALQVGIWVGMSIVVALLVAGAVWLGRASRWRRRSVPLLALALISLASIGSLLVASYFETVRQNQVPVVPEAFAIYRSSYEGLNVPQFSMAYPANWSPDAAPPTKNVPIQVKLRQREGHGADGSVHRGGCEVGHCWHAGDRRPERVAERLWVYGDTPAGDAVWRVGEADLH